MLLAFSGCKGPEADLPDGYRRVAVPAGVLSSEDALRRGRALFLDHCALCHGVGGDGRGVRREGLSSPPRDFTDPAWRRSTTPRLVYFAIREGRPHTPMPAWKALDPSQVWDLTAYVLSVGERP